MPRKSKYHRFRRGGAQKYNKITITPIKKQMHPLVQFNRNPFYLLFLICCTLTVFFLLTPQNVMRSSIQITFSIFSNVTLSILNTLKQMGNEIASQASSISIPDFTWQVPEVKLPHIEFNSPAISTPDLTTFFKETRLMLQILNPVPIAGWIYKNLALMQYYSLTYTVNTVSLVLQFLMLINPQSILFSLSVYFISGLKVIFAMFSKIASFVNPYPMMSKTIEIELNMLSVLTKFILFGLEFLGVSIYIILSIFINSLLGILQIAWSGVVLILSSILNFFSFINTKVVQIFNLIYLKIQYFALLIEPYTSYIAETFNRTISNFAKSANDLKNTSASVVNQYKSYHPK